MGKKKTILGIVQYKLFYTFDISTLKFNTTFIW